MKKPYVAIAVSSKCNFRCPYCDVDGKGEAISSRSSRMTTKFFREVVDTSYSLGVRKFRLTGGEPFLHPEIGGFVRYALRYADVTLTLDTNGSFLRDDEEIISVPPYGFQVVVSLDTLDPKRFPLLSGSGYRLEAVLRNINFLASAGLLKRINMVVNRYNFDEVFPMIEFCASIGTSLKLTDVAERHRQSRHHSEIFFDTHEIYDRVLANAEMELEHKYSQAFGSPMKKCRVRGCDVTLKHRKAGAHFSLDGICTNCPQFPCDEGLYFASAQPDESIVACQLSGFHKPSDAGSLGDRLQEMLYTIERSSYISGEEVIKLRRNKTCSTA